MGSYDVEEATFQADIKAIEAWWQDSRWRNTVRPFTAEQIASKRGNLKIEYPSNVQAKKLWEILEDRWKVCFLLLFLIVVGVAGSLGQLNRADM